MAEILLWMPLLSGSASSNISGADFLKFVIRSWKFNLAMHLCIYWCRAKMLQSKRDLYGFTEI